MSSNGGGVSRLFSGGRSRPFGFVESTKNGLSRHSAAKGRIQSRSSTGSTKKKRKEEVLLHQQSEEVEEKSSTICSKNSEDSLKTTNSKSRSSSSSSCVGSSYSGSSNMKKENELFLKKCRPILKSTETEEEKERHSIKARKISSLAPFCKKSSSGGGEEEDSEKSKIEKSNNNNNNNNNSSSSSQSIEKTDSSHLFLRPAAAMNSSTSSATASSSSTSIPISSSSRSQLHTRHSVFYLASSPLASSSSSSSPSSYSSSPFGSARSSSCSTIHEMLESKSNHHHHHHHSISHPSYDFDDPSSSSSSSSTNLLSNTAEAEAAVASSPPLYPTTAADSTPRQIDQRRGGKNSRRSGSTSFSLSSHLCSSFSPSLTPELHQNKKTAGQLEKYCSSSSRNNSNSNSNSSNGNSSHSASSERSPYSVSVITTPSSLGSPPSPPPPPALPETKVVTSRRGGNEKKTATIGWDCTLFPKLFQTLSSISPKYQSSRFSNFKSDRHLKNSSSPLPISSFHTGRSSSVSSSVSSSCCSICSPRCCSPRCKRCCLWFFCLPLFLSFLCALFAGGMFLGIFVSNTFPLVEVDSTKVQRPASIVFPFAASRDTQKKNIMALSADFFTDVLLKNPSQLTVHLTKSEIELVFVPSIGVLNHPRSDLGRVAASRWEMGIVEGIGGLGKLPSSSNSEGRSSNREEIAMMHQPTSGTTPHNHYDYQYLYHSFPPERHRNERQEMSSTSIAADSSTSSSSSNRKTAAEATRSKDKNEQTNNKEEPSASLLSLHNLFSVEEEEMVVQQHRRKLSYLEHRLSHFFPRGFRNFLASILSVVSEDNDDDVKVAAADFEVEKEEDNQKIRSTTISESFLGIGDNILFGRSLSLPSSYLRPGGRNGSFRRDNNRLFSYCLGISAINEGLPFELRPKESTLLSVRSKFVFIPVSPLCSTAAAAAAASTTTSSMSVFMSSSFSSVSNSATNGKLAADEKEATRMFDAIEFWRLVLTSCAVTDSLRMMLKFSNSRIKFWGLYVSLPQFFTPAFEVECSNLTKKIEEMTMTEEESK